MENMDERLWLMAKKRAAFKRNFYTYLVINVFLWGIWLFTSGKSSHSGIPWPAWVTLGWGVGIAFHYFDAYHRAGDSLEQQEYDRLKNK